MRFRNEFKRVGGIDVEICRDASGDGRELAAKAVVGVSDVGGGVGVIHGEERPENVVCILRYDSSRPGAGGELAVRGIRVGRPFAIFVELLDEQTRGRVVVPLGLVEGGMVEGVHGGRVERGVAGGGHGDHAAFGVVFVPDGIGGTVLLDNLATEIVDGVRGLTKGVDGLDLAAILVVDVGG